MRKLTKQVNKLDSIDSIDSLDSIEQLDKSNLVLFVGFQLIENYINSNIKSPINNFGSYSLKDKKPDKYNITINSIINHVKQHNYKLIFMLYNCTFISELLNSIKLHKLDVKVIAWHQKHYFKANIVPKLYAIMEYSTIQARKQVHYNKDYPNKYIYIPYPSILPQNYHQMVDSNNEEWRNRYTGKYILAGGNNGRDYKSMVRLAYQNPDINVILLFSDNKSLNRVSTLVQKYKGTDNKNKDLVLNNLKYYTDSDMYQFAYAIQKCYFMILPFIKPQSMAGHSVVAQAIYFEKPVITNLDSSMDEAVRNNENGYLVKCGDLTKYEEYSKKIWNDVNLYKKIIIQMKKDAPLRSFQYYESILVKYANKALLNESLD